MIKFAEEGAEIGSFFSCAPKQFCGGRNSGTQLSLPTFRIFAQPKVNNGFFWQS
jgi:hypothetical protein